MRQESRLRGCICASRAWRKSRQKPRDSVGSTGERGRTTPHTAAIAGMDVTPPAMRKSIAQSPLAPMIHASVVPS